MEILIKRIHELEKSAGRLEPAGSERLDFMRQAMDFAGKFIDNLPYSKAYCGEKEDRGALSVDGSSKSLASLLKVYDEEVASKGINAASGGHLGYVPGGGVFASAVADFMAAVTNVYAGLYYAAPGAVAIENEIINWLKSIFGFPGDASGTLTSGGSLANMIAITAARDHHGIRSANITRSVIYITEQTHHCIRKALRITGLEEAIVRIVALDDHFRMDVHDLGNKVAGDKQKGLNPFLVIATAGTTDTGAIDPLGDIAEICAGNQLWFHIDAAYGGFFILINSKKELFRGIEKADSLVTDPHKGLFIPYGTGAVIVKNKDAVMRSHRYTANYMRDSRQSAQDIDNPADLSPELTRHFRGLRIWLPLQMHGIQPFIDCLEQKTLLVRYFRLRIEALGFRTGPEPDLSISYFWYPSATVDEDTYNIRLLELIHADGRVFFSSTLIDGKFVIRIAVLSFRTSISTIDKAIEVIESAMVKLRMEFNYS